ncbi:MAG: extracellular solute-binding protein [Lachnospiraceae bacterium]|nr:extracellular solute-binding protein [Lachnospiraceae bacterium]
MKRRVAGLLGATLAASMMLGVAAQAADITVNLGIWPEDTLTDEITMHEGFLEKMKELRPDVEYVPAYYKYSTDTFMPMVEASTVPTVFESWFTEPQKLIKQGAVADITDQLEERGWLDAMNPAIRELLSDENGRIYGTPRDGYALGLMVNVDLFKQAGLVDENGVPKFPQTWDELAEDAKAIKEATGAAGLCLLAKDNAGGWHFSNIAWAFGATLVTENEDGTFTANLASDEAIAAMEYVKSLKWEYDVLTADPTSEDWGTGFTQIATDNAAMYIAANDAVNQPTAGNGMALENLAMCAIPAGPGGQYSLSGGTPYMFSKDATPEEIDAALDYLEVMGKCPVVSDETVSGLEADAQMRKDAGIPVIQKFPCWINEDFLAAEEKSIEENANVDPALYQPYFDAVSADGLRTEEPGQTQDMYAELTKVLQAVLTDESADVASLMQTANENYQTILDNAAPAAE